MTTSLGHTSVTSDDIVTVMVTNHMAYGGTKNFLEEITSYNI